MELKSLLDIPGVVGLVEVASDGTLLRAELPDGDGKSEAALAVLMGGAADQLGNLLNLGAFDHGVGNIGSQRMVILKLGEAYVGLVLGEQSSAALVSNAASSRLHPRRDNQNPSAET
jgi:hypothetical protein